MSKLKLMCAAVLAFTLGAFGLAGCSAGGESGSGSDGTQPQKVTIGTMPTEDILPLWIAEQEGLFQEAGVEAEVISFDSAQSLSSAITAGEVDMAMTDIMRAVKLSESGTPLVAEWVTLGAMAEQGRFGVLAPSDAEYSTLTELVDWMSNKKLDDSFGIGVAANTVPEYAFNKLCEEAGIPDGAIPAQEVASLPERYGLVASGQLAGAALPNSLLVLGEANGMKVIADDTQGENISQSIMVANASFAEEHPEEVAAVASAWDAAVELCAADPAAYRSILAEKANINAAIADDYPMSEYPFAMVDDQMQRPTEEMVTPILNWMRNKGYGADGVSYDAATGQFLIG